MRIKNIEIGKLHPHKDNPRKNIGDVTELAESVRKNGIMQNLTVVPDGSGDYTVVIGHRRLAAAKDAGLTELPCIISSMDERQQLCTMMEENMQRVDLTIQEQAYGFQYMLDLGETVESIAKKTGFSETTVKHRLEIAKLDRKVLEENAKSGGYQLTINDLIELEKVKDIGNRNTIVQNAYSHADLIIKIERAVQQEKEDAAMEKMEPLLEALGIHPMPKSLYSWTPGIEEIKKIELSKRLPKRLNVPEPADGEKLYWRVEYGSVLKIYRKADKKQDGESEEDIRRKEEAARVKELTEIATREKEKIREFIHWIDKGKIQSGKEELQSVQEIWNTIMTTDAEPGRREIYSARDVKEYDLSQEERVEMLDSFLMRKLSVQMIVLLGEILLTYKFRTVGYGREYMKTEGGNLRKVIDLLEELYGFRPGKELLKIADGTHELYKKEETN